VLLQGLKQSMPHLPTTWSAARAAAGKISHPGYGE